ncbi:MAG: hypothetical protein AAF573_15595, partial [Bacteroidota bacterium]
RGLPSSAGTALQRVLRLLLSLMSAFGVGFIFRFLGKQLGVGEAVWFEFIAVAAGVLTLIWLGVEASIRLGWYRRADASTV